MLKPDPEHCCVGDWFCCMAKLSFVAKVLLHLPSTMMWSLA